MSLQLTVTVGQPSFGAVLTVAGGRQPEGKTVRGKSQSDESRPQCSFDLGPGTVLDAEGGQPSRLTMPMLGWRMHSFWSKLVLLNK